MEAEQLTPRARREASFVFDENIIAKPLAPSGVDNVKSKNPALYFKWINCSFQGGSMYDAAKASGFVNATPVDVDIPGIAFKDGIFRWGDVILMKIDRNLALGAMKVPVVRALRQGGTAADVAMHRKNVEEVLNEVSAPSSQKAKIQAFTPSSKDLSGLPGMSDVVRK